jgi:hypothetical protein
MRFIEIPALITEDIEDPSIVEITEPITVSISGTTMTIDGGSKVSGEASVTLTGDVTVNAFTLQNIKQPSIHKISVKTNRKGNFTYVPNDTVTASSVSTTTKTGSDFEILLITTTGGETYVDFDMADYVSPALYTSNALTGFDISELTSTYGATAKLYKPDGTLLTTVTSATTGNGVNFGYTESTPQDVTYTLEVEDDLGRTSRYDLPRKWISYAMETNSTPGFEKLALAGNEYTSTTIVPNLTSTSKVRVHKTGNHGYLGINFKIQGRNSTNGAWVDIDDTGENENDDESKEFLAFGDYLYHRVWVKPTAKATTTVSSSNVVTLTLSNLTEENVTTSFTGADPYDINESTNTYVFEETTKIGTVLYTVTLGSETYTNAVTVTTEGTAYDYVTLAFANPTLSLTTSNVTISSAKLYRDDVLFHTYGTESNVVLRSDQTGTYQAVVNDVYYSNRVVPDFTTTRSVSAPQLEFDGYNRLNLSNITPTSTTLGVPDGTTRDLTTQSNVYIYEPGTYTANVQTSETFAYLSNVVTSQPSQNPTDVGPTFTFDEYNRLAISNITQTSSTLEYGSNTYDTNTASNVYVTDAGEYVLEARDANTFVMSNVYVGAVSQHPTDVVPTLTFDGYNKLTIDNVDTVETATIKKDGAAFATTTSNTVYIRDTGTYTAEVKGSNTYAIELSNVVTGTVSQHPADVVPSLTYDNYNKITLNQLNYADTTNVTYYSNTYNIGTAKTMYVKDTGEYVFKISGTDKYAESNVYVSSVDLAGAPTKPIDFDGYNKLTLIDAGSNVSANVTYFSNTYELGSANVLYINGAGTYDLEMSGSNVFALSNTVVSGSINSGGIGPPISPIAQSGTDADGVSWTNLSWYYDESVTTSNNDGHWYYGESENNGVTINSGNDGIKFNYTNNTWHDANSSTRPYNLTYNTSNGLVEYHEQNNNLGNAYFTSPYFGKERPSLTFDGYNKLTLENFTGSILSDVNSANASVTKVSGGGTSPDASSINSHVVLSNGDKAYHYNYTNDTNLVRNLFDNNTSTKAHGTSLSAGEYYEWGYEFVSSKKIGSMTFKTWTQGDTVGNISIYYYDGTTWKSVVNPSALGYDLATKPASYAELEITFSPVTATHFKIWVYAHPQSSNSNTPCISEWTLKSYKDGTLTDPNGDTYSLGQTQNDIYIEDTGEYILEVTNSDQSAVVKTNVGAISEPPVPSTSLQSFTLNDTTYSAVATKVSNGLITWNGPWVYDGTNKWIWTVNGPENYFVEKNLSTGQFRFGHVHPDLVGDSTVLYGDYATPDATTGIVEMPWNSTATSNHANHTYSYCKPPASGGVPTTLTFDGYNKLSIENLTPTSTRLTYGSNTYDIGTASNVYIEDAGTYKVATGDATTFAFVSNVVGALDSDPKYFTIFPSSITLGGWWGTNWSGSNYSKTSNTPTKIVYDLAGGVTAVLNGSQYGITFNATTTGIELDLNATGQADTPYTFTSPTITTAVTSGIITVGQTISIKALNGDEEATFTVPDFGYNIVPSLTYDTSNKLSIENLTPTSTTLTDPNGSSFDIGTASNVYIRDSGTYSIASKDANTFVLASTTVTGTPTGTTYVYDSNTFTTPSQTYDTTKTITVKNVPSTLTDVAGKIYKGSTAYTIHATTSSSNVIIKNTGTYVSVFTTATQAFLTNAIDVTTQPTTTSDDNTIEDAVTTSVDITLAFHYGSFDTVYGDADVEEAANNGRIFDDTPSGTYTWGSLDSTPSTASNQTTYTWTPSGTITADVLMVGAGGGGGNSDNNNGGGGGGGAGGLVYNSSVSLSGQKTITVGGPNSTVRGDGSSSTFTGLTSVVGGGKGGGAGGGAGNGGSGGGAYRNGTGGTGTAEQGNTGGSGSQTLSPSYNQGGSGGGGAGGAGVGATSATDGANGGAGLDYSSVFGTTYGDSGWFASGGAGGFHAGGSPGTAPNGGGGNGGASSGSAGTNGQNHTGGGGGGGSIASGPGSYGGSGIVLVKYTTTVGFAGSTAVPDETTTDAPSVTLDATDTTVTDPTLDLDFTATLPRTLKRYNGVTNSSIGARFNRHETNKKRIEKSISIPSSFSAELTANNASSPTTLTVTVANSKFVINGDETPTLGFIRGETYTFDQSDASNSGHPLVLATSEDGATQYTTGWTTTPSSPDYVPGVSGAQGTFIVPYDVPDTIYYKCNVHSNMGGEINTTFGNAFSLGDFTVAANTHVSGEYTLATNYDGTTSNLYVNGDLITQITPSPAISAGVKDFILGKEFDGYVKNFKFWNYAKRFLDL